MGENRTFLDTGRIAQSMPKGKKRVLRIVRNVRLLLAHGIHRSGQFKGQFAGWGKAPEDHIEHGLIAHPKLAQECGRLLGNFRDHGRPIQVDDDNGGRLRQQVEDARLLGFFEIYTQIKLRTGVSNLPGRGRRSIPLSCSS